MGMHRSFIDGPSVRRSALDPESLEITLSHEMFHTFEPTTTAPDDEGGERAVAAWFNRGPATFYQRELPYRFGLIDVGAFLSDRNFYAAHITRA